MRISIVWRVVTGLTLLIASPRASFSQSPTAESTVTRDGAYKEQQGLKLGDPAPEFELPGVDGKNHSLREYDQANVLVVVFTCNHCPTAQA